jgi:4a-hydroxytetrahydrobiopterin dehydratase
MKSPLRLHHLLRRPASVRTVTTIPPAAAAAGGGGEEPNWTPTATPRGQSLARALLSERRWELSQDLRALQRSYVFRGGFTHAMRFVRAVAEEAKRRGHHPEWGNVSSLSLSLPPSPQGMMEEAKRREKVYNTVVVRWTTHRPAGLGDVDAEMAAFCDLKAGEIGVKEGEVGEVGLLERVLPDGGCEGCGDAAGK